MIERLIVFTQKYPLDIIGIFFLLLPVLALFIRKAYASRVLIASALYFLFRFIEEIAVLYYSLIKHNNVNLHKGLLVIDILIVGEIYYLALENNSVAKRILISFTAIVLILAVINYTDNSLLFISGAVFRVFLVLASVLYFNKILTETRVYKILKHSMFWVNSGFLLYGAGTFMTWLFIDYLLDPKLVSDQTFDLFWNMGQLLSIIQCILVSIGLWVSKFDRENYIQPL